MKHPIKRSLAVKVGFAVVLVEAFTLFILGTFYTRRFSAEVDLRLTESLRRPGTLVAQGALRPESLGDRETMQRLAGDGLVDAMIVGVNGNVFHSLNPKHLGEDFGRIPGMWTSWLEAAASRPVELATKDGPNTYLIRITPLTTVAGQAPFLLAFIKIRTTEAEHEKNSIAMQFLVGSVAGIVATSLAILACFRWLVTSRVNEMLRAVETLAEGNYTVRMQDASTSDELSALQVGFNDMAAKLRQIIEDFERTVAELRGSELAIRQGEENFRRLFEMAPVPLMLVRKQGRAVVMTNRAMVTLFGPGATQPDQPSCEVQVWSGVYELLEQRGRLEGIEAEGRVEDGRRIPTAIYATTIQYHGDEMFLVGAVDLTERKQALAASQRSEASLRAFTDAIPEPAFLIDREGTLLVANEALARSFNQPGRALVGKNAYDYLPPSVLERRLPLINSVFETGKLVVFEDSNGDRDFVNYMSPAVDERGEVTRVAVLALNVTERRRAERALKESEERYRTVVELSPTGIVVAVNDRLVFVNAAVCAMAGVDGPHQMLGRSVYDFVPPGMRQLMTDRRKGVLQTGHLAEPTEGRILRVDGTEVIVESTAVFLRYGGQPAILNLLTNITERKRSERLIRESEERLRLALDSARMGTWELDLASGRVQWSETAGPIFGKPAGSPGISVDDYLALSHPEDRAAVATVLGDLPARSTEAFTEEHRIIWPDGSTHWLEIKGRVHRNPAGIATRMAGTVVDTTLRKQTEESLNALAQAVSGTTGGAFLVELTSQLARLLEADYAFIAELTGSAGLTARTVAVFAKGRLMENFSYSLEGTPCEQVVGQTLCSYPQSVQELFPDDRMLAELGVHAYIGVPLLDPAQRPTGLMVALYCRTMPNEQLAQSVLRIFATRAEAELERTRAEERISQLNRDLERRVEERTAQLVAANKELESFSYSVSHDLRAPLRNISGFLSLLLQNSQGTLTENSSRMLDIIGKEAKRMGTLIDDLLRLSRVSRAEMRTGPVDLNLLVSEVRESLALETKDRTVCWKIGNLPVLQGDQNLLRQVFANLIGNAVKYTGKRTEAAIEIGCQEEPSKGEYVIYVRDNGAGFDMAYAHKLFGVFQRLHGVKEFEGTGIGLATTHRIVQRHGGRIWAEARVGQGAVFYVALPG